MSEPADTDEAKMPRPLRASASGLAAAKDLRAIEKEMDKDSPEWAEKLIPYLEKAVPAVSRVLEAADFAAPYVEKYFAIMYQVFKECEEAFYGCMGFVLCFFGGVYPALILSVETFHQCGWDRTYEAVLDIYEETVKVKKKFDVASFENSFDGESKENDEVAAFTERMALFMEVANPRKIQGAIAILWGNYMCVLAALNIHFAQVISLGQGIGEVLQRVLNQYIVPVLKVTVAKKYHQWIPVLTGYVAKIIGVFLAWMAQSFLSAFHSGIRGGIMMSRAGFQYLAKKNGKEYDQEDSIMDEIVGYGAAMVGIYLQISAGFLLPFPLNLILFPLTSIEWGIRFALAGDDMFLNALF